MRVSVSNLAWDPQDDGRVARLLTQYSCDAIDVAPRKYFGDFSTTSEQSLRDLKAWWADRGIEITGMQSLLFGTTGLNVFGAASDQGRMLQYLQQVCRVGRGLGATRLVFGSPRNRDRSAIPDDRVLGMAVDFFRRLGDVAADYGVVFCLEPNPPVYGANFMTNSAETLAVVSAVDHPSIRMQLDTGAMHINAEDPERVFEDIFPWVGHIHLSEPQLVTLGTGPLEQQRFSALLKRHFGNFIAAIEMVPPSGGGVCEAIENSLRITERFYR